MDEISEMTDQNIQSSHDAEKSSVETSLRKLVVSTNTSSENGINSAYRFSSDSTYSYGGRGRGAYNYSGRPNDNRFFGNPGRMPDRWENYANIGEPIQGLPIVACRVPLNERLLRFNNVDLEQWFTPKNLMERVPTVGCVIDLTATNRYYDPKDFTDCDVQHAKIHCIGHEIPDDTTIQRFFSAMDNFLHDPRSRGRVVVVHCTHGLNRTGYLVARYLVVRRGYQPADAISVFNKARGYAIERENYLENLNQMIQEVCPNPVPLFQERDHVVDCHQPESTGSTNWRESTGSTNWRESTGSTYRREPTDSTYRREPSDSTYRREPTDTTCRREPTDSTYRREPTDSAYRREPTDSAYRREPTDSTYRREPTDSTYRREPTDSAYRREPTDSAYRREPTDSTYRREPTGSAYQRANYQQSRGHFGGRTWNESNYRGNYYRDRPYADRRNRYDRPIPSELPSNNETPNHRHDNRCRHQPERERTRAESRNYREFENDLLNTDNQPQLNDDHQRRVSNDVHRSSW